MITSLTDIRIDPAKLRKAREAKQLAQAEAARQSGIARQQLWNYESGRFAVPSDVLAKLCALYGVAIADLTNSPESFFA